MKRVGIIGVIFALCFCLVGCGEDSQGENISAEKSSEDQIRDDALEYFSLPEVIAFTDGTGDRITSISEAYNSGDRTKALSLYQEYQPIYNNLIRLDPDKVPYSMSDIRYQFAMAASNEGTAAGMYAVGAFVEGNEYLEKATEHMSEASRLIDEI